MTGRIGADRIATASPPRPAGGSAAPRGLPSRGKRRSGWAFHRSSSRGPRLHRRPRGRTGHGILLRRRHRQNACGNIRYPAELGDKYYEGGTTGTPTFDGDRALLAQPLGRYCFASTLPTGKSSGRKTCRRKPARRSRLGLHRRAAGAWDNLLVLNVGDAGLAVDKATGKIVWKSAPKECRLFHAAAVQARRATLVVLGNRRQSYVAVDPQTGKEAWRIRWLTQYGVNAADPIVERRPGISFPPATAKAAALFKLGRRARAGLENQGASHANERRRALPRPSLRRRR